MRRALALTLALAGSLATVSTAVPAAAQGCPPGLAKKNNGCTPPGLAKKGVNQDRRHDGAYRDREREVVYRYGVGDRIGDDYVIVREPRDYGLDPAYTYARTNDTVYRIDRETREVLQVVGLLSRLLN
ncbi:excinuclease ABC subunit A [Roseivivax marinus]|jgi:hypothetical protein|uniref:excinuclease ABC subunit A n=1 Tax=Roseivivax marinus TaxID=1379903 RepID=UPI001F03ECC6|nr:excinuclease ABC subunit A [Roseivivax marinus]UMA65227.1 excinuclease ABC subunit A [Roseivivax marinus]